MENWPVEYWLLCEGGKWNGMTELCHKQSVALLASGEGRNRGLGIKFAGMGEVRCAGGRKSRVGSAGMRGFDYL